MASGDTKTNQYLDIAANGTRADLPTDTCCETRTQSLIRGVAERVMDVEEEVERLENNPDVVDIVATYQDLQNYDTSGLTDKDIIRVLEDSTHNNNSTYYRWNATTNQFDFVGEISGGSSVNVVQTTGTSTTDVMSQKAVTDMVYNNGEKGKIQIGERASVSAPGNGTGIAIGIDASATQSGNIAIGDDASSTGSRGTAIGWNAKSNKANGVALGRQATAAGDNSVAIGWNAYASEKGQFDISTGSNVTAGYNNTNYRVLSGVHDPRIAHDAATKGYVDGLVGDVSAALNAINNGTGA